MSSRETDLTVSSVEAREEDVETSAESPAVNPLLQIHRLLRGRYWLAALLMVVGASAGGYVGYRITEPTYESTGLIRIKPSLPRILFQNDQNGVMPLFDIFVKSQVALMRSQRVIDLAMQHPEWKSLNRGLSAQQVVAFTSNLTAEHRRGTDLVAISFTDPDAEAARRAVVAVIDAYDRLYGESDSESVQSRLKLLEERRALLAAEHKKWTEQITRVGETAASGSIEHLYHANLERMLKLEAQLEEAEIAAAITGPAATQPASMPMLSVEALAIRIPEIARLVGSRRDLEWRIAVERQQLGENHRSVLENMAKLELLDVQLNETVEFYQTLLAGGDETQVQPITGGLTPQQLKNNEAKVRKVYDRVKAETEDLARKCMDLEQLRGKADEVKVKLDEVNQRIDQLNTEAGIGGRISIVSRGDRPLVPTKDLRMKLAAAGAAGCGGLGLSLVLLLGLLDRRVRHVSDVHQPQEPGQRILGMLPLMPEGIGDSEDATVAAHSVHHIRMLLQHRVQAHHTPVIAITSASPGAGKTSLTLALGLSYAASGARTLLIDCDIIGGGLTAKMKKRSRRRIGHILRRLGLINTEQLIAALKESSERGERVGETLMRQQLVTAADVEHALSVQQDAVVGLREALQGDAANECITGAGTPRLSVMPLGSAQRQHVAQLSYPALLRVIDQVRKWFDVVILDTGPILGSLEASVAAMAADGVVLTVAKGEQRPLVRTAIDQLQAVGGRLAGIVLNRAQTHEILSSGLSSSSRYSSVSQGEIPVTSLSNVDHQYLRLGPISNAVVALAEFAPGGKRS